MVVAGSDVVWIDGGVLLWRGWLSAGRLWYLVPEIPASTLNRLYCTIPACNFWVDALIRSRQPKLGAKSVTIGSQGRPRLRAKADHALRVVWRSMKRLRAIADRDYSETTSTVYWCIISKLKVPQNLYWMSNMFLWVDIFVYFVCYHVVPKRHSQLDYELNDL